MAAFYNKIVYAGKVLLDLTSDTVTPNTLMKGMKAHDASGKEIEGTAELSVSDDNAGNVTLNMFNLTAIDDGEGNVTVGG